MASSLPPALSKIFQNPFQKRLKGSQSLYQILGGLPRDGVGSLVSESRWASKGIPGCFYYVTRVKLKNGSFNGKAWGVLFWNAKGKPFGERKAIREVKIPGGLKYAWKHVPFSEVRWMGIDQELRRSGSTLTLKHDTITQTTAEPTSKASTTS